MNRHRHPSQNPDDNRQPPAGVHVDPVVVPITDELDLHTFRPRDVPDLLDDYFEACLEAGIRQVRLVHGKGKGVLKRRVRALLARHRLVAAFSDAPPQSGGWGATRVVLQRPAPPRVTPD